MKFSIYVVNRKHVAPFHIASLLLAIAPLWLMLAAANTSAHAQGTPPAWVQAFGSAGSGFSIANAIKAAPDHSLYVGGQFSGTATFGTKTVTASAPFDIFLAKYSPSGSLLWIAQASQTDTNYNPAGNGIDLDEDGNIYLTGRFVGNATFYSANPAGKKITLTNASQEAIFLAKYTPSGTPLWVQTGGTDCSYPDIGCASDGVAVNPAAGTVYIAGTTYGDTTFSSADGTSHDISVDSFYEGHMVLAKYDTNGNFLWAQTNFSYNLDSGGTGVAVDSKDNAYIIGWFTGPTVFSSADATSITVGPFSPVADQYGDYVGSDTFLAKYDKNGNAQWVNHFCGYTSYPGAVAVGPSGEVTLVGTTEDMNYLFPVYLTPVTSSTSVSSQPPAAGINLGSGTITNPGNTDEVIATYNPAGVLIRAQRRGGTASESATGDAYDSRDNLYVTGLVEGNAQPKLFVDEYSSKNLLWEASASAEDWTEPPLITPALTDFGPPALTVDDAGSVSVAGGYLGKASFGDINLSSTGTSEVFVAGLNTAYANRSADLLLRLYASPTPVKQGDLLTFTFPVWNRGPNVAYMESLKMQVPQGTTFDYIRISGTPGLGTCTHPLYQGTGEIVCDENSAMAPNTTWTLRLTVKVTAPSGSVITETGTATEVTPDPNLADNTATVSTTVQ